MNNIEKLAIEHASHTGFCEGDLEQVTFNIKQLEAFAKALQQSSETLTVNDLLIRNGIDPSKADFSDVQVAIREAIDKARE